MKVAGSENLKNSEKALILFIYFSAESMPYSQKYFLSDKSSRKTNK